MKIEKVVLIMDRDIDYSCQCFRRLPVYPVMPDMPESFHIRCVIRLPAPAFGDLVEGSAEAREKLIKAAPKLKAAGCRGIVADCGLMSRYQDDVAREVGIPFVGASLIQIPIAWHMVDAVER